MVLPFGSETIKKKEELVIASSKMEIYSQQDAPLSVPATSFPTCSSCLVQVCYFSAGWSVEEGRRRSFVERGVSTSSPQNTVYLFLFFTCSNRLVEVRGSTDHSGRTAMDTAFRRGWLASNVCSVAMLLFVKWCILKQFCFVRLLVA